MSDTPAPSSLTFAQLLDLPTKDAVGFYLGSLPPAALLDLVAQSWDSEKARLAANNDRLKKFRQSHKRGLASACPPPHRNDDVTAGAADDAVDSSASGDDSSVNAVAPAKRRWSVGRMWPWKVVEKFLYAHPQSLAETSVKVYEGVFKRWVEAFDVESHASKEVMAEGRDDPIAYLILHPAVVRKIGNEWMSKGDEPLSLATVDSRVKFLCYMASHWRRFEQHVGAEKAVPELQQYSAVLSERVRQDQSRKAPKMKYDVWITAVEKEFGKESLEYLFAWWFMDSPTRNDVFKIARSEEENDGKHNFVVIPEDKNNACTFIWNNSKTVVQGCKATETAYKLRGTYSPFVSKMLHDMIERYPGREWLFSKTKKDYLEFRRAIMEKTGDHDDKACINYQRRMLALWGREHLTPEEMVELHRKMQHSQTTGREVYEAAPLVTTASNDAAPTEMAVN
jgi:hypothetical protein